MTIERDRNGRKGSYITDADSLLEDTYEEPMSIEEYVDHIFENPKSASHASKYLLEAIEAEGTRTVIEEGEEKERYRFFDDPYNGGEHAILGNTEILNEFVDSLRSIAAERGKTEKIIWIEGPTATGKSEFKRCLINGLREYSKTPEGRRYTVEWNIASMHEWGKTDEDNWYESPVQSHPLTVFPKKVREKILEDLNKGSDDHIDVRVEADLDPFCREAYKFLEEKYRRQGKSELFSAVTDERHLRIKNYVVDLGKGIGVLHSEDSGRPKERLVGSWMSGMLQELNSRGRKNPQAFSYDGVLSQGNGLLTIVEDANQHADLLQRLLNVSDERSVKLDKGIKMDIDTLLLVISNPDLDAELDRKAELGEKDPLKALKRRLEKHEFKYLTNFSLETELLRREITNETGVWHSDDYDEIEKLVRSPLRLKIGNSRKVRERELAPHALEGAAMYNVVTRLDGSDVSAGIDLVDKAVLFDKGYIKEGDEHREKDDFDFDNESRDGEKGIPVTYPRDVIADLLNSESERHHPELDVENVIMPLDILDEMVNALDEEPMFSSKEKNTYEDRVKSVKDYVFHEQEEDVLDAMMRDKRVDEATVSDYIENVYAWAEEEEIENERGEVVEPDPLRMKVFETEHLGRFSEDDYADNNEPKSKVEKFRREKIVTAMNRHAWEHRTEDFQVTDIDVKEIPVIKTVLSTHDWEDVKRVYEDFDPNQWRDPPSDTETEEVKEMTIENMTEMFDYSEASAELTSRRVMQEVEYKWA